MVQISNNTGTSNMKDTNLLQFNKLIVKSTSEWFKYQTTQ